MNSFCEQTGMAFFIPSRVMAALVQICS